MWRVPNPKPQGPSWLQHMAESCWSWQVVLVARLHAAGHTVAPRGFRVGSLQGASLIMCR